MTLGFIPDHGSMAAVLTALYVEGTPQARASTWQRIQKGHGIAGWAADHAWALSAYRCTGCGRVELFATERPDPKLTFPPRE